MQPLSLLLSFLLHVGVFSLALLWPAPPPLDLKRTVYQVSVVIGDMGGQNRPSPVLGPQAAPQPANKAPERPSPSAAPTAPQQSPAVPSPVPDARAVAQAEVPAPSLPQPASQPTPPVPAPPKEATVPQIPAVQSRPTPQEKPKPEPQEKPKTEAPKPDLVKPAAQDTPKPAPKPAAPKKDPLADALADVRKQAEQGQKSTPPRRSSAASALADLQKSVGEGGGGGQGDGPGGGGLYDVFVGQVIEYVRPQWQMGIFSRQNLQVQVRIVLDTQGKVVDCKVETSSGNAAYDGAAVNAILRTRQLPVPPTPAQQDVIITFNSLEMAG